MAVQYTKQTGSSNQNSGQQLQGVDLSKARNEMDLELTNSKEVDDLVSTINVNESNTLVTFGAPAAEDISKCSDSILKSINMSQINDSGELLGTLAKIMDKFDIEEITTEEKKGIFSKMFGGMQKELDKILAKYHHMGEDVDKIYIQLKQYEDEINGANKKLDQMYESNLGYYRQLVKYILAGEQGIREIDQYLTDMRAEYDNSQDNMLYMDISNLEQAKIMLEQRVQDLRIAENVAMQSIPMIKSMQFGNMNLVRKINSAFIITLPIFKQAITQAVLLKRQKIQADAMKALDDKTNEMLLKNAQNTAAQTKLTTMLASGSSVKIETLEQTWKTIITGIEETKKIQEEASKKRIEDAVRLERIKEEYKGHLNK